MDTEIKVMNPLFLGPINSQDHWQALVDQIPEAPEDVIQVLKESKASDNQILLDTLMLSIIRKNLDYLKIAFASINENQDLLKSSYKEVYTLFSKGYMKYWKTAELAFSLLLHPKAVRAQPLIEEYCQKEGISKKQIEKIDDGPFGSLRSYRKVATFASACFTKKDESLSDTLWTNPYKNLYQRNKAAYYFSHFNIRSFRTHFRDLLVATSPRRPDLSSSLSRPRRSSFSEQSIKEQLESIISSKTPTERLTQEQCSLLGKLDLLREKFPKYFAQSLKTSYRLDSWKEDIVHLGLVQEVLEGKNLNLELEKIPARPLSARRQNELSYSKGQIVRISRSTSLSLEDFQDSITTYEKRIKACLLEKKPSEEKPHRIREKITTKDLEPYEWSALIRDINDASAESIANIFPSEETIQEARTSFLSALFRTSGMEENTGELAQFLLFSPDTPPSPRKSLLLQNQINKIYPSILSPEESHRIINEIKSEEHLKDFLTPFFENYTDNQKILDLLLSAATGSPSPSHSYSDKELKKAKKITKTIMADEKNIEITLDCLFLQQVPPPYFSPAIEFWGKLEQLVHKHLDKLSDPKELAQAIKFYSLLLQKLTKNHNYLAGQAVSIALGHSEITRKLKKYELEIDPSLLKPFDLTRHFLEYKKRTENLEEPFFPLISCKKKEFIFFMEGLKRLQTSLKTLQDKKKRKKEIKNLELELDNSQENEESAERLKMLKNPLALKEEIKHIESEIIKLQKKQEKHRSEFQKQLACLRALHPSVITRTDFFSHSPRPSSPYPQIERNDFTKSKEDHFNTIPGRKKDNPRKLKKVSLKRSSSSIKRKLVKKKK